uniref:Putative zinc finger, CCHC-type n=1 Tax=Tanacetum cinerariifolium TaxID=118510 RepID=A0A699HD02_TANCI|nr:putative zinc finger, CCHC-type [Tanacetum cinerariifolium]
MAGGNKQMGLLVLGLMLLSLGTTTVVVEGIACCSGSVHYCCWDANMPPANAMTPMSAFTDNKKGDKNMALVPKEGGSMSYQVPVLTSTNYPVWAVKVKSIMDAHGLWGTVEPRTLGEEPDVKKSKQALAFLFQVIPEDMRELESLRMKEGKSVDDFASKLSGLASKSRSPGYELEEVDLMKRLLNSMPKSFLQIVASIEQCFELDSMLFDEAVGRLKAEGKSHGCKNCGNGGSNRDDVGRDLERGRVSGKSRDGNERVRDKSHVKCYKCGEFGHYSNECPKWEKHEENLIEEEPTLL